MITQLEQLKYLWTEELKVYQKILSLAKLQRDILKQNPNPGSLTKLTAKRQDQMLKVDQLGQKAQCLHDFWLGCKSSPDHDVQDVKKLAQGIADHIVQILDVDQQTEKLMSEKKIMVNQSLDKVRSRKKIHGAYQKAYQFPGGHGLNTKG